MQYLTKQNILEYLSSFDAKKYGKTRNYVHGGVSKLSPYITHGIITTKECVQEIIKRYTLKEAEKFLMELVRKEFFLQVQKTYGNGFLHEPVWEDKTDIKKSTSLPSSLYTGTTPTERVNKTVGEMNKTGWLHNHKRMRLASRCCHRAKLDWKRLADRTYYHFIDGELSANHLSWQWVNSTFGNKAYFMNEKNLQTYRPGTTDPNLRGSYDQVAEHLFDKTRKSIFQDEKKMKTELITPTESLIPFENSIFDGYESMRILSPRRLDQNLLSDSLPTVVLLDTEFTKLHPRSEKRLHFIKQYTQKHNIPLIIGSYKSCINHALEKGIKVTIDERRDPIYRKVQKEYIGHEGVSLLPYDRINISHPKEALMKFFKYRNKTIRFIKELQK